MFGFKLSEGPRPKSERWSQMSVTRQQQQTLGHRRTVHVGFRCSASRPSTNPTNFRCFCPSLSGHPQLSPTVEASDNRNFFFLSRPLVTFLWRTKWRLRRPSRVWRDHLQFSAFRFLTLSMDAYFSPIPSKTKQSQLSFNWDGDSGPLPQNKLERPDNARSQFSPCISFTPGSPLHRFATRPPSCTLGIEICHPAMGPRNERLAVLDLNVQCRNGSTLNPTIGK